MMRRRAVFITSDSSQSHRLLGSHPSNFGRALGRVIAHETGHYFLQLLQNQHTSTGLMQTGFSGREWFLESENSTFSFSADQIRKLRERCPQRPVEHTPPPIGTEITPIPIEPIPILSGGGWSQADWAFFWLHMLSLRFYETDVIVLDDEE